MAALLDAFWAMSPPSRVLSCIGVAIVTWWFGFTFLKRLYNNCGKYMLRPNTDLTEAGWIAVLWPIMWVHVLAKALADVCYFVMWTGRREVISLYRSAKNALVSVELRNCPQCGNPHAGTYIQKTKEA